MCGTHARDALVCGPCAAALPARIAPETGLISVFEYRYPVDRLLLRFKFAGDLAVGRWLALQLAERAADADRPDVLVAPPLSPRRLRERGFNQALEIAKAVGRELDIDVDLGALVKVRETPSQPGLGRRERHRNLRGAFACRRRFDARHVAIVDDVLTTGATARSVARELKRAGAARVSVWTVARTPRD